MKAKQKKQEKPMDLPNPLRVDKKAFTDVIDKMINTEPVPLKDVERRKNPETDPRYLPVFPAMGKSTKRKTF
jgi:hypothetical protein